MSQLPAQKALLRDRVRRARDDLRADLHASRSRSVAKRLLTVPEVASARVVVAFHPHGSEVDVTPALHALLERGAELLLPWVEGPDLALSRVRDLGTLIPGWRGVLEPDPRARSAVTPGSADVVIVPGLAFDRRGGRLGYGGGHIDRLLAATAPAPVVAPALSLQVVDAVPREPHDLPVDVLVTEDAVHRREEI